MSRPRANPLLRAAGAPAGLGAALLALPALLGGCGRDVEATGGRWLHLAEGFVPAPLPAGPWRAAADGRGPLVLAPAEAPHALRAELELAAADWSATPWPGVWWCALPLASEGRPSAGAAEELLVAGRPLAAIGRERLEGGGARGGDEALEGFAVVGERLYLSWPGASAPPERALLRQWCERGRERDGRWGVSVGRWGGDGLPVWPGERVELELAVPPGSALSFAFVARAPGLAEAAEPPRLRVELDGIVLWQEAWRGPGPLHARVALPPGGVRRARLAFAVEGPAARCAVLCPVIGPAEVGGYGARPGVADGGRPDVVLFLADTFRADNLATYGGTEGLTPELDAFAAQSLVFERAWAPSSWTLPSQATLMTGLFPYQHGATDEASAVPAALVTLAEHLRAAGYRTGATTDEGFVTRATGMDAGFEWFDQHWGTLEEKLQAVELFLAMDDGRPTFLFVQTYATHAPYTPSERARTRLGERLEGLEFAELERVLVPEPALRSEGGALSEERARALAGYRDLYLGTVHDLDRAFGELRRSLERRGLLERGVLIFTSDHGEAFYEHGVLGHGLGVWEELLRVPLLIHAPGLAPRRVPHAAGLVDLPATVSALAGLAPHAGWLGHPLHELDRERPVFLFGCNNRGRAPSVALVEGDAKLVLDEQALRRTHPGTSEERAGATDGWAGTLLGAYDLARDPGEERDLGASAPWAEDALARLGAALGALLEPRTAGAGAEPGADELESLQQLGYLGR